MITDPRIEPGNLARIISFEVVCYTCREGCSADGDTFTKATAYLRKTGWRYTERHGWYCPKCVARGIRGREGN